MKRIAEFSHPEHHQNPPLARGRDLVRDLARRADSIHALPDLAGELERVRAVLWAMMVAEAAAPPPEPEQVGSAAAALLTVEEKAAALKKSACWVRRAIKRGDFPEARKVGGTWRLPP